MVGKIKLSLLKKYKENQIPEDENYAFNILFKDKRMIKVLELLIRYKDLNFTRKDVAQELGVSTAISYKLLENLEMAEIIVKKSAFGTQFHYFGLNRNNKIAVTLTRLYNQMKK